MKFTFRQASKSEPYWWNWDKSRYCKQIRLLCIEFLHLPDKSGEGLQVTVGRYQCALTWHCKRGGV
jgi:hypothetical protein